MSAVVVQISRCSQRPCAVGSLPFVLAQVGGDRGLGQQGIGGDGLAGEVAELVEQRDRDPDLVGALVGAVVTGQHGFF